MDEEFVKEVIKDMPERMQAVVRIVVDTIEKHGWSVTIVGATEDTPSYAYTTGLAQYGAPEVIITGLPLDVYAGITTNIANAIMDGKKFTPLEKCKGYLNNDYEVAMLPVSEEDKEAQMKVTNLLFPGGFEALQVLWPDSAGYLPFEEEFNQELWGYPILGPIKDYQ